VPTAAPKVIPKRLVLAGATDFDGSSAALGLFDLSEHDFGGARWYIRSAVYSSDGAAHTWDLGAYDGSDCWARVPGGTTSGSRFDHSDLHMPIPRDASGDLLPVKFITSGKAGEGRLYIEFEVKPAGVS